MRKLTPKEGQILSINICFKEDILLVRKASTRDNCQNLIYKLRSTWNLKVQEGLIVTVDEKIYFIREEHSIGYQTPNQMLC